MSIKVSALSLTRGPQRVLNSVDTEFPSGQLTALTGPNGSGKSSLLRCLYQFLHPSEGKVYLDDVELSTLSPRALAQKLGVCPQEAEATLDFLVSQVLSLRFQGCREACREALKALPFLDLEKLMDRRLSELSGGEKQRVRLGQSLLSDADWLLLDEPTNHLDLRTAWSVQEYLAERAQSGGGVVVALHDLGTAVRICQNMVVLKAGDVCASGPPSEVLQPELLAQVFGLRARIAKGPGSHSLEISGVVGSER